MNESPVVFPPLQYYEPETNAFIHHNLSAEAEHGEKVSNSRNPEFVVPKMPPRARTAGSNVSPRGNARSLSASPRAANFSRAVHNEQLPIKLFQLASPSEEMSESNLFDNSAFAPSVAPRNQSPIVSKAVESLAALKMHEYLVGRKRKSKVKHKLSDELRERKVGKRATQEIISGLHADYLKIMAAYKIKYYIETWRRRKRVAEHPLIMHQLENNAAAVRHQLDEMVERNNKLCDVPDSDVNALIQEREELLARVHDERIILGEKEMAIAEAEPVKLKLAEVKGQFQNYVQQSTDETMTSQSTQQKQNEANNVELHDMRQRHCSAMHDSTERYEKAMADQQLIKAQHQSQLQALKKQLHEQTFIPHPVQNSFPSCIDAEEPIGQQLMKACEEFDTRSTLLSHVVADRDEAVRQNKNLQKAIAALAVVIQTSMDENNDKSKSLAEVVEHGKVHLSLKQAEHEELKAEKEGFGELIASLAGELDRRNECAENLLMQREDWFYGEYVSPAIPTTRNGSPAPKGRAASASLSNSGYFVGRLGTPAASSRPSSMLSHRASASRCTKSSGEPRGEPFVSLGPNALAHTTSFDPEPTCDTLDNPRRRVSFVTPQKTQDVLEDNPPTKIGADSTMEARLFDLMSQLHSKIKILDTMNTEAVENASKIHEMKLIKREQERAKARDQLKQCDLRYWEGQVQMLTLLKTSFTRDLEQSKESLSALKEEVRSINKQKGVVKAAIRSWAIDFKKMNNRDPTKNEREEHAQCLFDVHAKATNELQEKLHEAISCTTCILEKKKEIKETEDSIEKAIRRSKFGTSPNCSRPPSPEGISKIRKQMFNVDDNEDLTIFTDFSVEANNRVPFSVNNANDSHSPVAAETGDNRQTLLDYFESGMMMEQQRQLQEQYLADSGSHQGSLSEGSGYHAYASTDIRAAARKSTIDYGDLDQNALDAFFDDMNISAMGMQLSAAKEKEVGSDEEDADNEDDEDDDNEEEDGAEVSSEDEDEEVDDDDEESKADEGEFSDSENEDEIDNILENLNIPVNTASVSSSQMREASLMSKHSLGEHSTTHDSDEIRMKMKQLWCTLCDLLEEDRDICQFISNLLKTREFLRNKIMIWTEDFERHIGLRPSEQDKRTDSNMHDCCNDFTSIQNKIRSKYVNYNILNVEITKASVLLQKMTDEIANSNILANQSLLNEDVSAALQNRPNIGLEPVFENPFEDMVRNVPEFMEHSSVYDFHVASQYDVSTVSIPEVPLDYESRKLRSEIDSLEKEKSELCEQLENTIGQVNEAGEEKNKCKKAIIQWIGHFTMENGRPPTAKDRNGNENQEIFSSYADSVREESQLDAHIHAANTRLMTLGSLIDEKTALLKEIEEGAGHSVSREVQDKTVDERPISSCSPSVKSGSPREDIADVAMNGDTIAAKGSISTEVQSVHLEPSIALSASPVFVTGSPELLSPVPVNQTAIDEQPTSKMMDLKPAGDDVTMSDDVGVIEAAWTTAKKELYKAKKEMTADKIAKNDKKQVVKKWMDAFSAENGRAATTNDRDHQADQTIFADYKSSQKKLVASTAHLAVVDKHVKKLFGMLELRGYVPISSAFSISEEASILSLKSLKPTEEFPKNVSIQENVIEETVAVAAAVVPQEDDPQEDDPQEDDPQEDDRIDQKIDTDAEVDEPSSTLVSSAVDPKVSSEDEVIVDNAAAVPVTAAAGDTVDVSVQTSDVLVDTTAGISKNVDVALDACKLEEEISLVESTNVVNEPNTQDNTDVIPAVSSAVTEETVTDSVVTVVVKTDSCSNEKIDENGENKEEGNVTVEPVEPLGPVVEAVESIDTIVPPTSRELVEAIQKESSTISSDTVKNIFSDLSLFFPYYYHPLPTGHPLLEIEDHFPLQVEDTVRKLSFHFTSNLLTSMVKLGKLAQPKNAPLKHFDYDGKGKTPPGSAGKTPPGSGGKSSDRRASKFVKSAAVATARRPAVKHLDPPKQHVDASKHRLDMKHQHHDKKHDVKHPVDSKHPKHELRSVSPVPAHRANKQEHPPNHQHPKPQNRSVSPPPDHQHPKPQNRSVSPPPDHQHRSASSEPHNHAASHEAKHSPDQRTPSDDKMNDGDKDRYPVEKGTSGSSNNDVISIKQSDIRSTASRIVAASKGDGEMTKEHLHELETKSLIGGSDITSRTLSIFVAPSLVESSMAESTVKEEEFHVLKEESDESSSSSEEESTLAAESSVECSSSVVVDGAVDPVKDVPEGLDVDGENTAMIRSESKEGSASDVKEVEDIAAPDVVVDPPKVVEKEESFEDRIKALNSEMTMLRSQLAEKKVEIADMQKKEEDKSNKRKELAKKIVQWEKTFQTRYRRAPKVSEKKNNKEVADYLSQIWTLQEDMQELQTERSETELYCVRLIEEIEEIACQIGEVEEEVVEAANLLAARKRALRIVTAFKNEKARLEAALTKYNMNFEAFNVLLKDLREDEVVSADKKTSLKKDINDWMRGFREENKREPTELDKQSDKVISSLFKRFAVVSAEMEQITVRTKNTEKIVVKTAGALEQKQRQLADLRYPTTELMDLYEAAISLGITNENQDTAEAAVPTTSPTTKEFEMPTYV